MRPNTSNRTPQTINEVVDEPVAGIVTGEPKLGLPPVLAPPVFDPPTGGVALPAITNVAVRWALTVPVIVTV